MRKITMIAVGTASALAEGLALAGPGMAPDGPTAANFSLTGGSLALTTPDGATFPAVALGTVTTSATRRWTSGRARAPPIPPASPFPGMRPGGSSTR